MLIWSVKYVNSVKSFHVSRILVKSSFLTKVETKTLKRKKVIYRDFEFVISCFYILLCFHILSLTGGTLGVICKIVKLFAKISENAYLSTLQAIPEKCKNNWCHVTKYDVVIRYSNVTLWKLLKYFTKFQVNILNCSKFIFIL